ncbi:hypothetical protein [Paenibacillus sp. HB172176]|uniref:TadE/TadG family type IV pilus assembly protein n=1 Tax=Paenibacillus sp. HB172176 TaxID=2493690 RepID=UPI001438CF7A|nr:hypothetical protein [Paenibacillus sp. HB172176]
MKQRQRSDLLIRIRKMSAVSGCERGSIVVEAAIVLPLVLIVLMIFALMISLCTSQMALNDVALQSTRQLAAYIRPVELARAQLQAHGAEAKESYELEASTASGILEKLPASSPELPSWSELASEAANWLPAPAGELAESVMTGDWQPVVDVAATELGSGVIEPFVRKFVNERLLDGERVKLSRLSLPDLKTKEKPYLGIELQYEYRIRIPFTDQPIRLRAKSYERVWVNDAAPAYDPQTANTESAVPIQIVSISPTPVLKGNKATVIAKTNPGAVISLKVFYKSGASKAKHLGDATADQEGFVAWTWLVSGNTTKGIWKLEASAAAGDGIDARYFVVAGREGSL